MKVSGKRKEHSLGTADRKLAERFLKKWIADIEKVASESARITLAVLLDKFVAVNRDKSAKTHATNTATINVFKTTWTPGLDWSKPRQARSPGGH